MSLLLSNTPRYGAPPCTHGAKGDPEIFSISGKPLVAKEELIHCIAMRKMPLRPSHSEKHRKLMEGFAPFMEARQAEKA